MCHEMAHQFIIFAEKSPPPMANSVRLLRRYAWLIDTLRRAGRLSLDEICSRWLDDRALRLETESEFPTRTFHRHRQAIADIFGIDIACDRTTNEYYIENPGALDEPSFTSWLFNGLALDNMLISNSEVARSIIFERTAGGSRHLPAIVGAIAAGTALRIDYRRFAATEAAAHTVEPYGLKQSAGRWYMLAKITGHTDLTVFALDRIEDLQATDSTFVPDANLDINTYFDDVIGVNVDSDYDVEPVTLRIYGSQRAYIESRPLHSSQTLIRTCRDYSDYRFVLSPEYEFQHAILALGPSAEILTPAWLRTELHSLASATANRYS